MAIEIPSEVALFLNFMGVPYPDINEDDVRALARHVRTFVASVEGTHESATGAIKDMGAVYSGHSYEQLVATWARMSASHLADLDRAGRAVATALDVAAEVITAVKIAVLAELAALATSYAAVLATPGALAIGPAVRAAAGKLCSAMEQMLMSYILAEVIGKAIEPFEHTIDRLISGIAYNAVSHALGVPASPGSSTVSPLHIEPDEVVRYAKVLDDHADDIMNHAATFADNVAKLDFITPGRHDSTDGRFVPRQHGIPAVAAEPTRGGGDPDISPAPSATETSHKITGPRATDVPAADVPGHAPTTTGRDDPPFAGEPGKAAATTAGPHVGPERPIGSDVGRMPDTGGAAGATPWAAGEHDSRRADAVHMPGRHAGAPASDTAQAPAGGPEGFTRPVTDSGRRDLESLTGPITSGGHAHDASGLAADNPSGSHPPRQTGRGSPASTTPWARSSQAPLSRTTPGKAAPPTPASVSGAPAAADRKPGETPWSRIGRRPSVAAKVFTPAAAKTAPAPRPGKVTARELDRQPSAGAQPVQRQPNPNQLSRHPKPLS